jgi:DNA-binding NarL/FixJ family response regulator
VTVRLYLCDDSASIRLLVREMVTEDGSIEVVGEAATVEEALAGLPSAAPDVILLDLLEHGSEDDLVARLRAVAPASRFVVYSGRPERDGAAADAHVHKSAPFDELRRVLAEVAADA